MAKSNFHQLWDAATDTLGNKNNTQTSMAINKS